MALPLALQAFSERDDEARQIVDALVEEGRRAGAQIPPGHYTVDLTLFLAAIRVIDPELSLASLRNAGFEIPEEDQVQISTVDNVPDRMLEAAAVVLERPTYEGTLRQALVTNHDRLQTLDQLHFYLQNHTDGAGRPALMLVERAIGVGQFGRMLATDGHLNVAAAREEELADLGAAVLDAYGRFVHRQDAEGAARATLEYIQDNVYIPRHLGDLQLDLPIIGDRRSRDALYPPKTDLDTFATTSRHAGIVVDKWRELNRADLGQMLVGDAIARVITARTDVFGVPSELLSEPPDLVGSDEEVLQAFGKRACDLLYVLPPPAPDAQIAWRDRLVREMITALVDHGTGIEDLGRHLDDMRNSAEAASPETQERWARTFLEGYIQAPSWDQAVESGLQRLQATEGDAQFSSERFQALLTHEDPGATPTQTWA